MADFHPFRSSGVDPLLPFGFKLNIAFMNRPTLSSSAHFLRRTIDPYVGVVVICALVTVFVLWVGYRASESNVLITMLVLWTLVGFNIWFGTRYRVWYDEHAIHLRSAGWGGGISIPFEEVSRISENTASVSEMTQGNHPFRRVIVFGRRASQPIYISTKHFAREDINQLVEIVAHRCPDVVLDKRLSRRIASNNRP